MKKTVLISCIILLAFTVVVVIVIINKSNFLKDSTSTRDNTPKETTSYTLQEVTTHKDETSCWAIINNKVYDLTDWINNHPGGPDKIVNICGTDGSQAFNMEHGGQPQPQTMLQQFYKGELKNN